jgi:hypothetical protein
MNFPNRLGSRRTPARPSSGGRHDLQPLESRTLFAAFTATSAADLIADINAANATPAADTITLAPGATFQLTKASNPTSATGLPAIKGALTIVGNGRTIERFAPPAPPYTGGIPPATTPPFRLFEVPAGAALTLTNLTLRGGLSSAGGAVFNQGALNLQGVTVRDNAAVGSWGMSVWGYILPGGNATGGGVYSAGTLTMSACTVRGNAATGGAGISGFMWGTDYSYSRAGPGGNGYGGGLYVAGGTASVAGSTFAANTARGGGGGAGANAQLGRSGGWGGSGMGGGVFAAAGVVTLRTTTLTANTAAGGLGGTGRLYNYATGQSTTIRAATGQGVGGGLYVKAPAAPARLDAFSKGKLIGNTASTASSDLFGPYATIV